MDDKKKLAEELRAWRGPNTTVAVAKKMEISPRTLQGIEQGRGFNYPHLLRTYMKHVRPGLQHRGKKGAA